MLVFAGTVVLCYSLLPLLIVRLRSSGFGCYLFGVYFGCLMFADAILLLAHPVSAMRHNVEDM